MVANPELITLDDDTNTIVLDIRGDFTADLAALYDYLEKVLSLPPLSLASLPLPLHLLFCSTMQTSLTSNE